MLDRTPFYAESGGQVGDAGVLTKDETMANVLDTYSPVQGLIVHKSQDDKGRLTSAMSYPLRSTLRSAMRRDAITQQRT